ncbi:hypothetical protein DLREEDagrD3_01020 [Denitratisoma sp. agr-D3]
MKTLLCSLLLVASLPALAADLDVKTPWVRSTVEGQPATGAFMELTSPAGATLVGAASPVAGTVELHEMKMDNGVMKMRALPQLEVPAGKAVSLAPGGLHVMLMDLKSTLKPGSSVPITLKFKNAQGKVQQVEVKAEVRDMTAPAARPMDHEKMHDAMQQHMQGGQK